MAASISRKLIKGIEYLSLPFQYPARALDLLGKILTNRPLVHELPRLSPYRNWLTGMGIQTIIDVGSYIGSFAFAMRTILPEVQIYSFEPLQDNFARLMKNLAPLGNFEAFNTAIGDRQGELEFHRSEFSPSSSALEMGTLHRQAFPHTAHTSLVRVPVARLDDYQDKLDLSPPVLLKIDVQGYEEAVLRGATRTLEKVDLVEIEVSYQPLYAGQVLFDGIYRHLAKAGFRFAGILDSLTSPIDGSILQSDALFSRDR